MFFNGEYILWANSLRLVCTRSEGLSLGVRYSITATRNIPSIPNLKVLLRHHDVLLTSPTPHIQLQLDSIHVYPRESWLYATK